MHVRVRNIHAHRHAMRGINAYQQHKKNRRTVNREGACALERNNEPLDIYVSAMQRTISFTISID